MRTRSVRAAVLFAAVAVCGCVTMPSGPAVPVMPGAGKTLAQFQKDDALCRDFAKQQLAGVTPNQAAASSGIASAAIGTGVGAATGAAVDGGEGAAVGAGAGLLAGSLIGLGVAGDSSARLQYRYDTAYAQCMATQGNHLPDAPPAVAAAPAPPGPVYLSPYYYYGPPPYYPAPYFSGYGFYGYW